MAVTDTETAPWFVVDADDKRRARLNCISHLLSQIPYKAVPRRKVELPKRQKPKGYKESPRTVRRIPGVY
jgi:polyphosphate kinase